MPYLETWVSRRCEPEAVLEPATGIRISLFKRGMAIGLLAAGGVALGLTLGDPRVGDSSAQSLSAPPLETRRADVVNSLEYLPDGLTIVAGSTDGGVGICDVASGRFRVLGAIKPGCFVAGSLDGQWLAISDRSRVIQLVERYSGKLRGVLERPSSAPMIGQLAFSPDGCTLAAYQVGGSLWLFDLAGGRHPVRLRPAGGSSACLTFSPDSATIVTTTADGIIEFWRARAARLQERWHLGDRCLGVAAAYAPDGKTLAVGGSGEFNVQLRDVTTGRVRTQLQGQRSGIRALAFSADGLLLAAGSSDGEVNVWDLTSGRSKLTLKADRSAIWRIAFAPNGKTLAVGGLGGKVRLWDLDARPEPVCRTLTLRQRKG